jgi:putative methionine-R-sulfoxide reductase with GAF domain/membrane protein implicated in regulation of membrane protease activity
LLLAHCIGNEVVAQPADRYTYQYLTTADGLPSSEIICLLKDQSGFLWLGTTAGMSRYDGYTFQNYTNALSHELIGHVNVIRMDAAGRLWIGSTAGLYYHEGSSIIKLSTASTKAMSVNDIFIEGNTTVWLATENGPAKLSVKQIDFTGKRKTSLEQHILNGWIYPKDSIEQRSVFLISRSGDGAVFFSGRNDLFRLMNGRIEKLYTTARKRDQIQSIFPVSYSKIFFDGASTEMNLFERGIVTAIPYKKFYQRGVQQSLPGLWYVGTRGAFYFHPQTATASMHLSFSDAYTIWPSAVLQDIGFLWVATHDGLVKLKPAIFSKPVVNDFYSLLERKNGTLLLGANRGFIFERSSDSLIPYQQHVVPDAEVRAMYEDEQGSIWLGTGYQGLVLLNNGTQRRFTKADGLHSNSLLSFSKTVNGGFYAAGDRGVTRINIDQKKSISFTPYYYSPNVSRHAKFFSMIESPDAVLWMGGEEGLVYLRNDSLHSFTIDVKKYAIQYMIKDRTGNVWIATAGNGILVCRFNASNMLELVRQYTEADGLNSLHYLTLLADEDNNIWAGSSRGISVIGRAGKFTGRVMNFDVVDGFIRPGYSYMRLLQSRDGNIHVVTTYGTSVFNPYTISLPDVPPVVYISRVMQGRSNGKAATDQLQQTGKEHRFSYVQNSFQFRFIALDYQNPEGLRYYYRLKGIDTAWTNSGKLRDVSFENLPHGNYSFEVKALNSKGTWSGNNAVYAFIIGVPFWKTWWFLLLVLLSGALLITLLVRTRIRRVRTKAEAEAVMQQRRASVYKEQLEIEQIINHFATSMNGLRSVDDILWDVAKNCISKLRFEDCIIYMKEGKDGLLIQKAAWGPKMTAENTIRQPIEIKPGHGIVGSVALTGKPEIVNDTTIDDRYIVDDVRRMSEITVPVISDGEVIGIIDSEHSKKNFYTDRHLQILTTISTLCAVKIKTIVAEQQIMEKEMEVLRLSKDFATSQLTALRMQMNPHFIFNALNSVQHYILKGDVVEATKYLSRFSKLQREILHFGTQQFISLQVEIDMLNRYLELEQNRFGDSFTYSIQTTDEVEPEEIKIPPMMLQPFVENAIWHGLMPKENDRSLNISFGLYDDDILLATLKDNGIGRATSAKLRQGMGGNASTHQSRGMSIVQERLRLLQQQYGKPFDIKITDITAVDGTVTGTQVVLKIYIGDKNL